MWSLVRRVYWILAVILISGCSGGGCSGCAGGALHEIPGGYSIAPETRMPRAAQVRLTQSGLHAIEAIAPGLLASFTGTGINVPRSVTNLSVGKAILCPSGACALHIGLPTTPQPLELAFAPPSAIAARIRVTAAGDIPVQACVGGCDDNCHGFFCATIAAPTIRVDTSGGTHSYIGLSTHIDITRDTHAERRDYHRADLVSPTGSGDAIQQTPGEEVETADIMCSGSWVCGIVDLLRGTLLSQFTSQFSRALAPIQAALAQKSTPNPPGCPTGTTDHSGTCQYADGTVVPQLLGTEGTGNFGALVGSITPGVQAPATYLLAAGDHEHDAQVVNMGLSLDLFGGMVSAGHNTCVPRVAEPTLTAVPEWTSLRGNTIPGTMTPIDLGIGVSEDYMNHAAFQLWDAGLFCLGVGTSSSQQLAAGTLAILPQLNSLRQVMFPSTNAPIAVVLRPQTPPNVHLGHGTNVTTDPLITVALPHLALDFYVWSEERFVRFMTLTTDLSLPLNLQADAMGLTPVLGMLHTDHTVATNSQLLSNDPAGIAVALQAILGPALGMLGGAIPAIHLPAIPVPGTGGTSLGSIAIHIPPMGAQGVSEGSSRFLGIFANLAFVPAAMHPDSAMLDTTATLESVQVTREFFHTPGALRLENLPRVTFTVGTPNDFGRGAEYSYRVDQATWSLFSRDTRYVVQDLAFVAQGSHTIEVRARMAGLPETADADPARFEVVIDTEAPALHARLDGDDIVATAIDQVSPQVEYAFQFDDGGRTPWSAISRMAVPSDAAAVRVFARDPSGNESQVAIARAAIIRGGRSTDATSGCGCTVAGGNTPASTSVLALGGLLALAAFLSRRHRNRIDTVTLRRTVPARAALVLRALPVALLAGALGCSSSDSNTGNTGDGGGVSTDLGARDAATGDTGGPGMSCTAPQALCASSNTCITPPDCPMCMPGYGAMGSPTFTASTCMFDTSSCSCMRLPPLSPGAFGTYLDMATGADGSIWLSGYSEGVPDDGTHYGDLIVGRYTGETGSITWTHVDGVPSGAMPTADPMGWRGGISDAGDDVGRFTSIALTTDNHPRVTYWDVTHNRLKYASFDGTTWTTHTVDDSGPNGKYTSLVLLAGGIPVVAYRATVVHGEVVNTVVRIARANSANPAHATDWTTTDVATTPSPCRAADCAAGTACRKSDGHCAATATTCTASCSSSQACFGMACADVYLPNWVEGVSPGALYTRLARDTMGRLYLSWYDRDRGNLMLATGDAMGHFTAPTLLDGEDAMHHDTGDRGIYAALAVGTDNTVHIAYVDGWQERLLYLRVVGGVPMGAPEVIDDGSQAGPTPFADGTHIVGDSASISVATDGTVRVAYGDSTAGTLRLATRAVAGGAHPWTLSVLDQMNSTGYWSVISGTNAATWWRDLSNGDMRQWGVRVLPLH